jgi:hypothetical protein
VVSLVIPGNSECGHSGLLVLKKEKKFYNKSPLGRHIETRLRKILVKLGMFIFVLLSNVFDHCAFHHTQITKINYCPRIDILDNKAF